MTENDSSIVCKYTAQLKTENGRYVIAVPDAEVEYGPLTTDGAYQVTIERVTAQSQDTTTTATSSNSGPQASGTQAPVAEGERVNVEIEDLGQQGDGIARVGPGYVLIVPGSDVGDSVTVEVQEINPNFGFAEIVARHDTEESADDESTTAAAEPASDTGEGDEPASQDDDTADAPTMADHN